MCKATGVEEHFIGEDFVGVVQDLICDVLAVSAEPGTIILDTGCRKSVAGQAWHVQMSTCLQRHGLKAILVDQHDHFTFGNGKSVVSTCSWKYPLKMCGCIIPVVIAEVSCPCPPLLSHELMKELGVVLHLGQQTIDVESLGVSGFPLLHSASGHPMLHVCEYVPDDVIPVEFLVDTCGVLHVMAKHIPSSACEPVERLVQEMIVPMHFSRTNIQQEEAPRSMLLGAYTRRGVGVARKTQKRSPLVAAIHELAKFRP
eukprot:6478394-Amphidinium_carterae.1